MRRPNPPSAVQDSAILPRSCRKSGFSLIEMLVVIAVIGIIAAIAIPSIANLSDTAEKTIVKRNAQNFASVSASLASVGVEHVIPDSLGGVEATCRLFRIGLTVPDGPFAGFYFGLPGVPIDDISQTFAYLDLEFERFAARQLIFNGNASP